MSQSSDALLATAPSILERARCIVCETRLGGESSCPRCGRAFPSRDGILEAIGPLSGRNRIVAAFYDGPGWRRFQHWERGFLLLQGGARRARMQILRHVLAVDRPDATGLEVGIGDGTTRGFGAGDAVLFEDLTGQGHTSRSVGGDRLTAIVPLAAEPK